MHETYCGKECQACADRARMNCPGCSDNRKNCTIAQCCREKGHETCETCAFSGTCRKLMGRDSVPSRIRKQQEFLEATADRAAKREAETLRRAPIMAKWLSVMFWVIILSNIFGLVGEIPSLALICEIAAALCGLGIAWALLQLQGEDGRYRTAAICLAVTTVVSLVLALISGGGEAPAWTLVISLPGTAVQLVGEYNKCMAHSCIVGGVDSALGEKWEKIWKWQKIALGSLAGSLVLLLIIPVLGMLVALAAAVALAVVAIMEIVALYRSAEAFKKKFS